jgi:WD40 repeat protein
MGTTWVNSIQALPDGRIVSGNSRGRILISSQDQRGKWVSEEIASCGSEVHSLQVLSDGRLVSGHEDGTIRVFDGEAVPEAAP